METCSHYRYLPTHLERLVYGLRMRLPMFTNRKGTSYDSILVIIDKDGYTPFELDCSYRPRVFYEDIE